MKQSNLQTILVPGGAGYVGAVLIPKLLEQGHHVRVLDLYIYGDHVFQEYKSHPNLTELKGDLRDPQTVASAVEGCNSVIHLACISNDPSFELNPELGKSINYDSFNPFVACCKEAGIERFIFASSSSVYGIKEENNVTEELPLEPLTDYSKYKALCEDILLTHQSPSFTTVIVRPATVCGYSPRQRLDLTVNILTNHAVTNNKITVFGGTQKRPNIHIEDITDLYITLLDYPANKIAGKVWNAGYENHPVQEIADIVKGEVGEHVEIVTTPTDDLRSYHISSDRIKNDIGFIPKHTIRDAVSDLLHAFNEGRLQNSMDDPKYFNIKMMQKIDLR